MSDRILVIKKGCVALPMAVQIKLSVESNSDGRVWIAQCPSIDVASQAGTKRAALKSLREGIELWFESCISRNVLREALAASGFKQLKAGERLPTDAANTVVTRSIPDSASDNRRAESPTIDFAVKQRSGQQFLEGWIPATLVRGGPYNHAAS